MLLSFNHEGRNLEHEEDSRQNSIPRLDNVQDGLRLFNVRRNRAVADSPYLISAIKLRHHERTKTVRVGVLICDHPVVEVIRVNCGNNFDEILKQARAVSFANNLLNLIQ